MIRGHGLSVIFEPRLGSIRNAAAQIDWLANRFRKSHRTRKFFLDDRR
jgi:hypothetical protein